ncbi:MAG: type II toxin-antitoxin system VapC family toxin [Cellulomonadaceae bacterium]|jgi:ribonuclease VapC|nr:type II toxin-antitoxin system VapC family toxin [Cellulomonadaceae bacterium]
MVIDTSALMAILNNESIAGRVKDAMIEADDIAISAATLVELQAVLSHRGDSAMLRDAEQLLRDADVITADFTASQAVRARLAYREYGKASGHRAKLNMGDCFSYALATEIGEPLLYVGDDFIYTDVISALDSPLP